MKYIVLLVCVCACAQVPDAPTPSIKPFAIVATISERDQQRQTPPPLIETIIGGAIRYQFASGLTASLGYGYAIQPHNNSITGTLSYPLVRFGKRKKMKP